MKKILSILLIFALFSSAMFAANVSATEPEPLTKEEYDNMQKTVGFVCSIYFARAMSTFNSYLYFEALEMYPDNVEYEDWDVDHTSQPIVVIEYDELFTVAKTKYPYVDDTTLNDLLVSRIASGEIVRLHFRGGFGGFRYIKDSDKGDFDGYTANNDDTYSLYFTIHPELEATEVLTEEELEEYYKLEAEATKEGFESNGYRFYYSYRQAGFFTYGEPEYREFNFSLTDDGKVIYNYDRWDVELPEKFDDIPTDAVPGDMNGDEQTDNKDVVTLFRAVSGNSGGYNAAFDFNEDGEVNNKDVVALFRFVSAAK